MTHEDAVLARESALSTSRVMSSFSSVIRKPGAQVAPKVAPRRNIVRKAAPTQSNAAATAIPAAPEPSKTVQAASVAEVDNDVPEVVVPQAQQAEGSIARQTVAGEQNEGHGEPSGSGDEPATASGQIVVEAVVPQTPNWPVQKRRPERNSITPRPASANRTVSTIPDQTPRPETSDSRGSAEEAAKNQGSSSTSHSAVSPETPRPRSKRKQPPRGSAKVILAQPALLTPPMTQPSHSPSHERQSSVVSQRAQSIVSQRSDAEEALDRINSQLRRVGDIAAEIVRATPAREISTPTEEPLNETTARPQVRKRRKKNNGDPQTIQDQAAEIVANAIGTTNPTRGRRRNATPEDAEAHVIEEENTTMFDLCDGKSKYGKISEIEKQMTANWKEIKKRRAEDAAARLAASGRRKKGKMEIPEERVEGIAEGPEFLIQDGKIVAGSREIDRQAATTTIANAVLEEDVREDTDIYKRINSSTVGPSKRQIAPGQQWDDLSTEQFYQGLKMFGTDFKMISNMIPGKNRRQVKLKYNAEERTDWAKVQRCLGQKEEVNLESYATMTGLEFKSVTDVYKEIEEEEKALREADEQRRREEGIISQQQEELGTGEADVPIPSIEGQDGEHAAAETDADGMPVAQSDRQSTTAATRLGSTTTGRHTVQPQAAKKKQQTRKSTTTTGKKGRQANAKNKGFEGVEERLGDANEIGIPGG